MTTNFLSILSQKSLVLIFAYAPAGLGHLRVTDALCDGLPKNTPSVLLGSHDKTISLIHRFTSIHPIARKIMEWTQQGKAEDWFTFLYRLFLRNRTGLIYEQLTTVLDQRIDTAKIILVISTHFGIAHQLSAIKDRLVSERKIKVFLIVQVTDDSPQHLWFVDGADLIFVPSKKTKEELIAYGIKRRLPKVQFEVTSYPISQLLTQKLTEKKYRERKNQLDNNSKALIHMSVPISGAAVGTDYLIKFIDDLYQHSSRFFFHVVSRSTGFTAGFLQQMLKRQFVKLYISVSDREVVNKYEEMLTNNLISIEVTKPSEQAFKALINPQSVGGVILLFSKPIGRQEYDNLNFLRRHGLIPTEKQRYDLYNLFSKNLNPDEKLSKFAKQWRGLEIPDNPSIAASFVHWCFKENIFKLMIDWKWEKDIIRESKGELGCDGVRQFWEKVSLFLQDNV